MVARVPSGALRQAEIARGFNARWSDESDLNAILEALTASLTPAEREGVEAVRFYAAGIDDGAPPAFVIRQLARRFPRAHVDAASDLMLVAHALFDGRSGIVGILGTGSVAARYMPPQLTDWMRSLGYLYGDEGSGNHIGRRLLQYHVSKLIPSAARRQITAFLDIAPDDYPALLNRLYSETPPKLSGLVRAMTPFFHARWWQMIVRECFREFVHFKIRPLYQARPMPIGISGGIADVFSKDLKAVFTAARLPAPKIIRAPLPLMMQRL